MFTIDDAKRVQQDFGLLERHVAYVDLDGEGFVLAYTDWERGALGLQRLSECMIHQWLVTDRPEKFLACCFPVPGWYQINIVHDVESLAF